MLKVNVSMILHHCKDKDSRSRVVVLSIKILILGTVFQETFIL